MPQGSVLGPPGWNVLYDGLLRQPLPEGASIVAFVDDVALIVVAKSIDDIQHLGDEAIEVVADWLSRHGLNLAAEKTEAVLIARTKKRKYATFTVEDKKIRPVDTINLGVTIDARLTFKEHLRNAGLKASEVARALASIMPNIGGPKQPRRSLFSTMVTSVILYGAPIWAKAMISHTSYGAPCRRAYRTAALRVARAFHTVSDIALSVIAGLPPLALLATERAIKYREGRHTEEDNVSQGRCHGQLSSRASKEWQRRWDLAEESRWTHRVIPDVEKWIGRRHGFVTYHLTQVLTGHGCFRSYLHRIRMYHSAQCPVCPGINEDVEHACNNGSEIIAAMYRTKKDEGSLTDYRFWHFQKPTIPSAFKLETLSPTEAVARQHCCRTYYELQK